MVFLTKEDRAMNGRSIEGFCLSTDTKPTDDVLAGIMVEVDTGKVSFYNADGSEWVEQFSFQS